MIRFLVAVLLVWAAAAVFSHIPTPVPSPPCEG